MSTTKGSNKVIEKSTRGRKPTGLAKSSTERGKALEYALRESGGRILSRVRLSQEAASALETIKGKFETDRASIESALIHFAKKK